MSLDFNYAAFISHMVQMKDTQMGMMIAFTARFISHMVQMKVEISIKALKDLQKDFISHMVQMKVLFAISGKEETLNFISHMVQMKAWARAVITAFGITLYPTWFRWKLKNQEQ